MTRARSRIGFVCLWSRRCSIGRAFPGGVTSGAASSTARWCRTRATSPAELVLDLVILVPQQEGRPIAYSLFGHSAGGQFVDRLAAFVPTEARRIVVANAG